MRRGGLVMERRRVTLNERSEVAQVMVDFVSAVQIGGSETRADRIKSQCMSFRVWVGKSVKMW